jgi:methionyl-tRNA formyltransferase
MRGFTPWPGAYTEFRGQICHLWGHPVAAGNATLAAPGTISVRSGKVSVVCGAATELLLEHVKLEGRKEVPAVEFINGARLLTGERFGKT